jgi:hypothetical protein
MANQLDLAEAQLLGYSHCKKGYSLIDLVISMGLKISEWEKIKKEYPQSLSDDDIKEVDIHFERGKKKIKI